MSDKVFKLTVVTPDKSLVRDEPVTAVGVMGSEGAFTALPGHVPFLTDLKVGQTMWYRSATSEESFVLGGGFVEVLPDRVTILADSAERPDEIDLERAEIARQTATRLLDEAKHLPPDQRPKIEISEIELQLQRAVGRIKAASGRGFKSQ